MTKKSKVVKPLVVEETFRVAAGTAACIEREGFSTILIGLQAAALEELDWLAPELATKTFTLSHFKILSEAERRTPNGAAVLIAFDSHQSR